MAQTMSASVAAKTPICSRWYSAASAHVITELGTYPSPRGPTQPLRTTGPAGAHPGADPGEEGDGFAIGCCELAASVADALRPIGVGAPGGALEDQTRVVLEGEIDVGPEVAAERGASGVVGEQGEGREMREIDALVEDQGGFDAAVGEEGVAGELGEAGAVTGHEFPLTGYAEGSGGMAHGTLRVMDPELRRAWTEIVTADDYERHMAAIGQAQAAAELTGGRCGRRDWRRGTR